MTTINIGERIAEARARQTPDLSQRGLSQRLKEAGMDVTPADVAAIEAGKRTLTYYERTILASTLNIPVHQFIA